MQRRPPTTSTRARARVRSRPGSAIQIRASVAIVKGGLIRKMERQDATDHEPDLCSDRDRNRNATGEDERA